MLDRSAAALIAALTCLCGLVAVGVAAHLIPSGESLDARLLDAFTALREYDVEGVLTTSVHLADPLPYLFLSSAIVLTAIARERPRLAAAVAVALVAAPLSAEILKLATAHVRPASTAYSNHINAASWPSGHAAGAMTAALCAVIVAPRSLRPVVAVVGGLFALLMGYAVIALVWHFPSDVVGSYLLSAAWALLVVAAVRRWPDPASERQTHTNVAAGVAVAVLMCVALAVFGLSFMRPGELIDDAAKNTTLFAGGLGIAALAAVLAAMLVRSTRGD
jgi:membrane-associated phospholipid phosphatase